MKQKRSFKIGVAGTLLTVGLLTAAFTTRTASESVIASQRNDLALLVIVLRQSVEELVLDLSALILLDVVRVDADRVVDVEVQRRTGVRSGSVAALLAARSKKSHGARSEGAANKGATTHNGLVEHRISHAILLMR